MRAAGLALLAATTCNCNSIFKIDQSQPWDAHLPIDAADYPATITWQTYLGGSSATFDPIDGLAVEVGSLDGTVPPMPVAVDPMTGVFKIPNQLGQKPTRVLFDSPYDHVPTEIQSGLQGFTYAFPIFGRHGAARAPADGSAMFDGSATGAMTYAHERLVTTGLWAVEDASTVLTGGTFQFAYGAAESLSGPLGVPQGSAGDAQVVLYMSGSADDIGFATFSANGLSSPVNGTFASTPIVTVTPNTAATDDGTGRVGDAVGGSPSALYWAGVIPMTTAMPPFAQPLGSQMAPAGGPPPVMLPLDESNPNGAGSFMFQNPFDGAHGAPELQLAVYSSASSARTVIVGGIGTVLATALQGIALVSDGSASTNEDVGIAESSLFDGSAVKVDGMPISASTEPMLRLSFSVDKPVDECTATLFKFAGGALVPVVRYIVMAPVTQPIMVATTYFNSTDTFTFGIECELGHAPGALAMNDYTRPTYPFSISSTFTPTFVVQ